MKKKKTIWIVGLLAFILFLLLGYKYVSEHHRHRWMTLEEICDVTDENSSKFCSSQECKLKCSDHYCHYMIGFEQPNLCTSKGCWAFSPDECPLKSCQVLKNKSGEQKCVHLGIENIGT